jgi:hypothetical protein
MPIPPSLIGGGLAGWSFLQASLDKQEATFASSSDITRSRDKLSETLSEPFSLDSLMGDRQVLRPVLQAFGLETEIDKGAFIRRIIEDGPDNSDGFARRLNNPDFIALSRAFQADNDGLIRIGSAQRDQIVANFQRVAFQTAVGEQQPDLRLALNFENSVRDLAADSSSDKSFWFRIIGNAPLYEVFETAISLPDGFLNLDIDKQADILQRRAEQVLGSDPVSKLTSDEGVETMTRQFLLQRQIENGPDGFSSGSIALSLLGGGLGSSGIENLLLSASI